MSRPRATRLLLVAALVLFALNLRSPIVAVSGVLGHIITDLSLTVAAAGVLTTLPVLAFAVVTPLAARLLRWSGADVGLALTLLGLLIGMVLRASGGVGALIAGTAVIGLSITLGNLVVPMLVHRDYPERRRAGVMGLYTVALNVGTMSTLVATAPLADAFGWRIALLSGVVPVAVAAIVWLVCVGWRRMCVPNSADRRMSGTVSPGGGQSWRVWMLACSFGAQAFLYYAITAWLPQLLAATQGMNVTESSAAASLFQIFAIVGGIGVPLLLRALPYWGVMIVMAAMWIAVPTGLLLVAEWWFVWLSLGGVAQGGFFTLVFIVVVQIAPSATAAARSSALVQCVGYGVGALGPLLIGVILEVSGSWIAPLTVLLAASVVLAALGIWAVSGLRSAGGGADGPSIPA